MKKVNKSQVFKFVLQILIIAVAGLVGGAAFKSFFEMLNPSIIPTGMSGFALLVKTWLSRIGIKMSTSIIYLILNVVLFACALRFVGWKYILLSGVGLGTYVLGMEFGYIDAIIKSVNGEHLILCIVGSMITGFAVGVAMRMGGSTGGSDIFGTLLNRAVPKVKTGYWILVFNVFVLSLSILTNGLQTGLYALINSILSSLVTNMVLDNSKKIIAYYIICDKPDQISQAIFSQYGRGVTRIDGTGMFTGNNKAILLCLVPYDQSYKMRQFVTKIDENAFVFSTPVTQTIGENNLLKQPLQGPQNVDNVDNLGAEIKQKEKANEQNKEVLQAKEKKTKSPAIKTDNEKSTDNKAKATKKATSSKRQTTSSHSQSQKPKRQNKKKDA